MAKIKCMNSWDIQSKHVFDITGICETLYSGECRWGGGEHYVCYENKDLSKCYGISRSMLKGGMNAGGMPVEENIQPTITANGASAVCYAIENHPNDSRVTIDPNGIVQTLSSRMGTGGNNTPFVLICDEGPKEPTVLNSSGGA